MSNDKDIRLSVIVPCYNEGSKLLVAYKKLSHSLFEQFKSSFTEIIFVNDGSVDNSAQIVEQEIKPLHNELTEEHGEYWPSFMFLNKTINKGKGFAINQGILRANGKTILYCDTDMSTDLKDLTTALNLVESGATIAFGSRILETSNLPQEKKKKRKLLSNLSQKVIALSFGWEVIDTQCGFKAMNSVFARNVAHVQSIHRFAFDVEYLYAAKLGGLEIVDFPVTWIDDKDSRVHVIKDSLRFLRDIILIKKNKKFLRLAARDEL